MTELEKKETISRPLFAILVIVFSYLFVIFSALHSADKPVGGGDTWVAMALGRYTLGPWATHDNNRTMQMKILDAFGIHMTWDDPISANSRPYVKGVKGCEGWVNQNWLSHVMFYKLKTTCGEGSIVIYKFIQAILTALFAFWAARALKVNYFLAAVCASFGVLLARSYIDMRPNITTIFMAIIMIYLLFRWKAGHPKSILWLFPLMIIWSNVHGGFIYAIVVFGIACGGYAVSNVLSKSFPTLFDFYDWKKQYVWLLVGFGITVFTPMIFSPYGSENLFHPLMVMFGDEGKIWRNVSEWHPVYQEGFGNTGSFFAFCAVFAVTVLLWIIVRSRFTFPQLTENDGSVTTNGLIFFTALPIAWISNAYLKAKKGSGSEKDDYVCMPTLDLTWVGIVLLTFYMAISSRRFVFLAGVVLSPFLAILLEQIFFMTKDFWQKKFTLPAITKVVAVIMIAATVFTGFVFVAAVNDIYYTPPLDGFDLTVFRRMVGILDQPVKAAQFIADNNIQGVVLNEWTNGGYIPWAQQPNETTGRPLCKVYMDGRAQAAYRVEHFEKWQHLNINARGSQAQMQADIKNRKALLEQLVKKSGAKTITPAVYDALVESCSQNSQLYAQLMYAMGADPVLYGKVLEKEGINVVLAKEANSRRTITYLEKLPNWKTIYVDDRYNVIVNTDSPYNRHLFETDIEQLQYPDDFTRSLSLVDYYVHDSADKDTYRAKLLKAEQLLADIDDSNRFLTYGSVYRVKYMLNKKQDVISFFENEYVRLKKLVDENVEFGKKSNLVGLHMCCHYLAALYQEQKDNEKAMKYKNEKEKYQAELKSLNDSATSGWFW